MPNIKRPEPRVFKCLKCKIRKVEFEYHNDSTARNGKKTRCKSCSKAARDDEKKRPKRTAKSDPKLDWDLPPSYNIKLPHQLRIRGYAGSMGATLV